MNETRVDVLSDTTSKLHDRLIKLETDVLRLSIACVILTVVVGITVKKNAT